MSMTHKEALYAVWCEHDQRTVEKLDASIRAYIEARGLALVPMDATGKMRAAQAIAEELYETDSKADAWSAMLSAAPDPFKDDSA